MVLVAWVEVVILGEEARGFGATAWSCPAGVSAKLAQVAEQTASQVKPVGAGGALNGFYLPVI